MVELCNPATHLIGRPYLVPKLTPNVTLEQLRAGITRVTGTTHQLVIKRIPVRILELRVGFEFNSAVLLPTRPDSEVEQIAPPFFVLRKVFDYAAENPGRKLLIAGHTDSAGGTALNQKISEHRARSAHALLVGDANAWATSAQQWNKPKDVQTLLKWASTHHGLGCDPGAIDGVLGPRSKRALVRFRKRYNYDFAGQLQENDSLIGVEDWKAFFDLYERFLARVLGTTKDELSSKRSKLTFLGDPVLGCGEHWPAANAKIANADHSADRRVDFVFFDEDGFPPLQPQSPPGYELYGMDLRFRRSMIHCKHDVLEIRAISVDGHPIPEAAYRVTFQRGATREGKLERSGSAFEFGVPEESFTVIYPESNDVFVKALAARLRYALEQPQDFRAVCMVLSQNATTLDAVEHAYSKHHNHLSGEGLAADVTKASKGTPYEGICDHLLAAAGIERIKPESGAVAVYAPEPLSEPATRRSQGGARYV